MQALPRLEVLTLSGNLITDRGLSQIASDGDLKILDLEATEVTDAGLVYIEGMKNLEAVNLGATRVTKEAVTQLQMARPDLRSSSTPTRRSRKASSSLGEPAQ